MWVPSYLSIECPPTFLQEKRIFHSNRCQHLTGMLPAVNVYILSFQELPSQVIILADCVCLMAVGCVVAVGDGGGQDCSPVLSGVSDWYLGLSSLSPSRHGGLWHSVASPVPSPHSVPPAVSTDNITSADSAPQHSNTTTPDRQHSRECRYRPRFLRWNFLNILLSTNQGSGQWKSRKNPTIIERKFISA